MPLGAKRGALALLALSWGGLAWLGASPLALGVAGLGFTALALVLWRRPCPSWETLALARGAAE